MLFVKKGDQGECSGRRVDIYMQVTVVRGYSGALGRYNWNEWRCGGDEAVPGQVARSSQLPKNPGAIGKCMRKILDSTSEHSLYMGFLGSRRTLRRRYSSSVGQQM